MAQGWVITWHPPLNKSFQVGYYEVEYKEGDGLWLTTQPIINENAYLCM